MRAEPREIADLSLDRARGSERSKARIPPIAGIGSILALVSKCLLAAPHSWPRTLYPIGWHAGQLYQSDRTPGLRARKLRNRHRPNRVEAYSEPVMKARYFHHQPRRGVTAIGPIAHAVEDDDQIETLPATKAAVIPNKTM